MAGAFPSNAFFENGGSFLNAKNKLFWWKINLLAAVCFSGDYTGGSYNPRQILFSERRINSVRVAAVIIPGKFGGSFENLAAVSKIWRQFEKFGGSFVKPLFNTNGEFSRTSNITGFIHSDFAALQTRGISSNTETNHQWSTLHILSRHPIFHEDGKYDTNLESSFSKKGAQGV